MCIFEFKASKQVFSSSIVPITIIHLCTLDTGHFFDTSLIQGLVFEGIVKGQESKVWAFFKTLARYIVKSIVLELQFVCI